MQNESFFEASNFKSEAATLWHPDMTYSGHEI